MQESVTDLLLSGPWPPVVGEHLAVKTQEDGHPTPKICEFLGFVPGIPKEAGNVRVKVYNQYFLNVPTNLALWQDNDSTEFIIEKSNVLPVRPQIEVVPSLSRMTRSGRQIVFQVENFEVIQCISADLFN